MRIEDILKAARKIVEHTGHLDQKTFGSDEWTMDAVLRNFTVIGEAVRFIPEDVVAANPTAPPPVVADDHGGYGGVAVTVQLSVSTWRRRGSGSTRPTSSRPRVSGR
jgi:hypothetical protein